MGCRVRCTSLAAGGALRISPQYKVVQGHLIDEPAAACGGHLSAADVFASQRRKIHLREQATEFLSWHLRLARDLTYGIHQTKAKQSNSAAEKSAE